MSHRYHPDPDLDDPQGAILYDDCPRCEQQAGSPWRLDPGKLRRAWQLSHGDDWSGLTANERILVGQLYKTQVTIGRLKEAGITL